MILTQRQPLYPDQQTIFTLWYISRCCNRLWNCLVEDRRKAYAERRWVSAYDQKRMIPGFKEEDERYKDPSSQILQEVALTLDDAFQSFLAKRANGDLEARPPKFRSGNRFFTQSYPQRGRCFEVFDHGELRLAFGRRPTDWLRIPLPPGDYARVKTAKVSFEPLAKRFYVSLTEEVDAPEPRTEGATLYFDPGVRTTLCGISSKGEFFEYDIGPLRAMNRSTYLLLDELISRRDRKQKGSRARRRLNRRISKLWRKVDGRTHSYLHTLARRILEDHPDVKRFRVGDWKKKETLADTESRFANKCINRAVQNNNPVWRLVGYLSYKAQLNGQSVDRFDERGTTRTCVRCDHVHEEGIAPSQRTFVCESCGFEFPRDHHSGLNFLKRFEPAVWHSLPASEVGRSRRTTLAPFSLKVQRTAYAL